MSEEKVAFISHSSHDAKIAELVCEKLENRGLPCWIAPRDLLPGTSFPRNLVRGIKTCNLVVLIFSARTSSSEYVQKEIILANDYHKAVIPFRIEDVKPENDLELYLAGLQCIEAMTPPQESDLQALADHVEKLSKTGGEQFSEGSLPQKIAPAKSWFSLFRSKRTKIGLGVAIFCAMIVISFALSKYLHKSLDNDLTLHEEVLSRLQQSFASQDLRINCSSCTSKTPHINVTVRDGKVFLSGAATSKDLAQLKQLHLDIRGIQSLDVSVETIPTPAPENIPPSNKYMKTRSQGSKETSRESVSTSATLSPSQLRVQLLIEEANADLRTGNYFSARNRFQTALDIDPDNKKAQKGLEKALKSQ